MRLFKKILAIVNRIINVVGVSFILLFVAMVCLQRFTNNNFSFFGYRMFTVVTGSMEPRYLIGDVLISKDLAASEIEVGDDVTYLGKRNSYAGKVVTHEVVSIEKDNNNKTIFHTKGLNNVIEDPIVYEEQLYGKVIYKSKILSFIYKLVGTPTGILIFVVLPLVYIIGSEMLTFLLEKEAKKRKIKE